MSGRAFVILMDEREQARERVEKASEEVARLERSITFARSRLSDEQRDLDEIEAAMHRIDPAAMAILTGETEQEGQVER